MGGRSQHVPSPLFRISGFATSASSITFGGESQWAVSETRNGHTLQILRQEKITRPVESSPYLQRPDAKAVVANRCGHDEAALNVPDAVEQLAVPLPHPTNGCTA